VVLLQGLPQDLDGKGCFFVFPLTGEAFFGNILNLLRLGVVQGALPVNIIIYIIA